MNDPERNDGYAAIQAAIYTWDTCKHAGTPNYAHLLEECAYQLVASMPTGPELRLASSLGLSTELTAEERPHHAAAALIDRAKERNLDGTEAWQWVVDCYVDATVRNRGGR